MVRFLALALVAGGLMLWAGAAGAAPLRGGQGGLFGGRPPETRVLPFNVDPSPCGPEARSDGRGNDQDRLGCRLPPRPRVNEGPRRPGSNAFGLQFDPYAE